MNIIGLYDQFGPSYHRIYVPLKTIKGVDKCLITNHLTEARIEEHGCDVLFYNRLPPANELEEVIKLKEKYGFKIVVDMDDHFNLDATHIMHDYYQEHGISSKIINSLSIADAITVTHGRLGDALSSYHQNIWAVPNSINRGFEQFQIDRTKSERIRLFWQGSITHENDLKILRYPLSRISNDPIANKIFMVMCGFHEGEKTWERMAHYYTAGLKIPGAIQGGTEAEKYYANYSFADIALIPLVESRFNSYKSNLKVLEAAAAGIPVIVSAVHPYKDDFPPEFVNYVHNQTEWYKHIKRLTNDPEERKAQGMQLSAWCNIYYNFDAINATRFELFQSLCNP